MKAEILNEWLAAAQNLWEDSPELRSKYNHDLSAFLKEVRLRLEAQQEWYDNPSLQREFGDFGRFLIYKKALSRGDVKCHP